MPHASRRNLLFLAIAVYCLLVLPRMLSHGMFLDGITYASIARNMAENYGSFWRPYYTATVYPIFYEHPPLGFWLQSWAYRLCGDSPYVEAFWGFVVGGLMLVALGRNDLGRVARISSVRTGKGSCGARQSHYLLYQEFSFLHLLLSPGLL